MSTRSILGLGLLFALAIGHEPSRADDVPPKAAKEAEMIAKLNAEKAEITKRLAEVNAQLDKLLFGKTTTVLGMTLVNPTDELMKHYQLPEQYPGPIILKIENASSLFPRSMAAFEGCQFWIVEHPANGFLFSKQNKPRFQPKTIRTWAEAIVACTASPEEYEQLLKDTRQAARERAEKLTDKPEEKERLMRIANTQGVPEENVGKYICRVVYNYPKTSGRTGTMTTYIHMSKEQFEEVKGLLQK